MLSTKLEFQKGQVKFSTPFPTPTAAGIARPGPIINFFFHPFFFERLSPSPSFFYAFHIVLTLPPYYHLFVLRFFDVDEAIRPAGSSLFIVYQPAQYTLYITPANY